MITKRVLLKLLIVAVIVASLGTIPSAPAYAGTNGQQLSVYVGASATSITIEGRNQYNQWVTWTSSTKSFHTFGTTNWWWKGTVTITVFFGGSSRRTCSANVPTSQWFNDWYKVWCTYG
jgi:hypothetical protein